MEKTPLKHMYKAKIGDKELTVDLFDLPYAEFNAENPLVIFGNVVLAETQRSTNLSNVKIVGNFDCSNQKVMIVFPKTVEGAFTCRSNKRMQDATNPANSIEVFNSGFVFPKGVTEIQCENSITNLNYFVGRIPSTVKKIVVADSVLSELKSDIKSLAEAKLFQQRYPNIVVVAAKSKRTLAESIEIKPSTQKFEIDPDYLKNPFARPAAEYTYRLVKITEPVEEQKSQENQANEEIKKVADKAHELAEAGAKVIVMEEPEKTAEPVEKAVVIDEKPAETAVPVAEPKKSKYPVQTKDFVNIQDIFMIVKTDPIIQSYGVSDEELDKEIRKHIKYLDRQIRFNELLNKDMTCILASRFPELLNRVINVFEKAARKKQKAEKKKEQQKKKLAEQKQQTGARKTNKSNKHDIALPVVIKKYIPKGLWKDICRECGKSLALQQIVLESIAALNTELEETPSNTHVHIINPKTGARTTSSFIKREKAYSIVQSISNSLQDNRRIVWTYLKDAKIFVCTGVFHEHTNTKGKNNYSKVRDFADAGKDGNGNKITPETITSDKYYDIDFLLTKYVEINKALAEEEEKEAKAKADKVIEQVPAEKPLEQKTIDSEAKVIEATRSSITAPTTEYKPEEPVVKIEEKAEAVVKENHDTVEEKPVIKIETPHNLVEVRAAETQVNALIDLLTQTINQDLLSIPEEKDIAKQIQQVELVHDALIQKAKIQSLLSEVGKTTDIMKQMQTYLNGHEK